MVADTANPFNVYGNIFKEIEISDQIDNQLGFSRYHEGPTRLGWLINMHEVKFVTIPLTFIDYGERSRMGQWKISS